MAHEPTLRKLHEMRLAAMADSYQNQLLDPNFQALSFEERFGLLVDMEWSRRKNNRLSSLIRKADFQQRKTYKKIPLLILDEWLLVSLKESEARDLLEIVEARHQKGSTIFCSQFAPAGWHGKIGESTLADAILDRIVHSSYTITIEGMDSMRKRKGLIN
ncbi:hypothetical protein A8709_32520 [Paenibacillus pectinilyticus]|uniref:IstB-like ATP-binding domain-containing protein n=1 Tax=Paenibacillus pectinilyticus TaxID=512399 RepID=A0A1C0ZWT8_9BACL|nr:ATP-binding protein [Paenibacillus pectinilyticus]OCT12547.1 hypothetical protein A8709_32520 [Paenibacillus pectinilyticus]